MNENKKNRRYSGFLRKIAVFVIVIAIFTAFSIDSNIFTVSAADYENHWAKNIFDEWVRTGILVPDQSGNIYPESLITRGQLCSYINRVMGFATMADISQYADTPYGSQYYPDMAIAVNRGYISPTAGNSLSPYGNITRGQVIDAFVKVARITPSYNDEAILARVRDASDIPSVNRSTVASAIVNGYLAGRPGYRVDPNDYMTVSEAIVLLDRLNSSRRVYAFPGKFGPEAGSVISNYSAILAPGVTLQNAEIAKDLDIQQETGEGEVNLNRINVREKLLVNGGRIITLGNTNIKEIQINKRGASVVYAADGNSEADTLIINGDNVNVSINKGNKTRKIIINGANATVNVGENVRIEDLTVNGENARVNLAKGSRLDRAELNAKTQIFGKDGSIGDLIVNTGGGGSEIEPRPGGNVDVATGEDVTIDNRPSTNVAGAKRIISLSFETPFTLKVTTEDVGKLSIAKNDFRVDVDGSLSNDFTVSKSNAKEFNIIFSAQIPPSALVTVSGTGNLTGSASISQNSQALLKDAVATGLRTINVTVTNPENTPLSKDNFRLLIAAKDSDAFTISALSLTSYNLNLAADIKNGQVLTVSGKNGLAGSVTVSAVSAIKSIVFNDTEKFTVNTDNTAGNKIDADSFDIFLNGSAQDFTVSEKSKTAYQITLASDIAAGDTVRVEGKRYLTGKLEEQYISPFKVSKVTVNGKTSITITLSKAPDSILTTEKHSGSFKVLVDDISIPVTDIKKESSDAKNVIYNLTVNLEDTQGALSVNGVKDSKNKGLVDYISPELVSVRINDQPLNQNTPLFRAEQSKAKIILEFTEPVFRQAPSGKFGNKDVDVSGTAFNIISGTGSGMDLNGIKITATVNSVIIDLAGAKRMDPGIYTLSISNRLIFDSFGNICEVPENNIFRFEIKGTLPTVASTKQGANGDFEIKLNGTYADNFGTAMSHTGTVVIIDPTTSGSGSRREIDYRFLSYDAKAKTLYISRSALPPALDDPNNPDYLGGNIPYRVELYNRDYTRAAGQSEPENENPLIISRAKIDTQRPRIERITISGEMLFDKDAGLTQTPVRVSKSNAVIQVVFSKPVFEQAPSKKFSAVGTDGLPFNIDTAHALDPGGNLSLQGVKIASSNRTVSIPLRSASILNPGDYKLEID
ncbi:MAG: S-layer homology domain-containing protein, partial [Oscillospiraceae bacterium]|nr:S-layer homology domain-containing protein [Oscillospiraceae bacterium]